MDTIYNKTNEYDVAEISRKMGDITDLMDEEASKPVEEQSKERMRELMFAQFYQGLRLSTGRLCF